MKGGKRKGAGRPIGTVKEITTKKMTITIYPYELEKIKQLAEQKGKSLSRFMIEKSLS